MKNLILVFVLTAAPAGAATVTLDTSFHATAFQAGTVVDLPGFDTNLGSLTAASIELTGNFGLGPYVVQDGTGPVTLSSVLLASWFSNFVFTPQAGLPVVDGEAIGAHGFTFDATNAMPLDATYDPQMTLFPYTRMSGADPVADFDPSNVNGMVYMSYTYDPAAQPVPEPGSFFILGGALVLSVVALRRRA